MLLSETDKFQEGLEGHPTLLLQFSVPRTNVRDMQSWRAQSLCGDQDHQVEE